MFFIVIFFFLLLLSPVHGDDFTFNHDGLYNQFYQASSISIKELPIVSEGAGGIDYESSLVIGEESSDVILNHSISTLTDTGFKRRIPNIVDRVAGPPGTKIDIYYYFYNDTGHDVTVREVAIPFSREISTLGDWTGILAPPVNSLELRELPFLYNSRSRNRAGKYQIYDIEELFESGEMGIIHLGSVEIKSPIIVKDILLKENENMVDIEVLIMNDTNTYLNNIIFEHGEYGEIITLSPDEEYLILYSLPKSEELGFFKITNPIRKTVCTTLGNNLDDWQFLSGISLLGYREDGGWVTGACVQPSVESFCISRISYSMTSDILKYENILEDDNMTGEEDITGEKNNEREDEKILQEEVGQNVLGAFTVKQEKILPRTGIK